MDPQVQANSHKLAYEQQEMEFNGLFMQSQAYTVTEAAILIQTTAMVIIVI